MTATTLDPEAYWNALEDEEDEGRTLMQCLVDWALLPAAILFVTTVLLLGTVVATWAIFKLVAAIVAIVV